MQTLLLGFLVNEAMIWESKDLLERWYRLCPHDFSMIFLGCLPRWPLYLRMVFDILASNGLFLGMQKNSKKTTTSSSWVGTVSLRWNILNEKKSSTTVILSPDIFLTKRKPTKKRYPRVCSLPTSVWQKDFDVRIWRTSKKYIPSWPIQKIPKNVSRFLQKEMPKYSILR